MPDKFLIFDAAFNGNGTSSAEAASNGAAGAWNQESILTGTAPAYGTLVAGDVVYIRSKTGNGANADKTITVAANQIIGNAAATAALPITWILDNGAVWNGQNGVLKWDCSSSTPNLLVTVRSHNRFIAQTQDALLVDYRLADPNTRTAVTASAGSYLKGWAVDMSDKTGPNVGNAYSNQGATIENCKAVYGRLSHQVCIAAANVHAVYINPLIELMYTAVPTGNTGAVFATSHSSNRGGKTTVVGGCVYGAAADDGFASLVRAGELVWNQETQFFGTEFPKQMPFSNPAHFTQNYGQRLSAIGADAGYGAVLAEPWGTLDSRNMTYNYPTLNATMPDTGSTAWSWRLYAPYASFSAPAHAFVGKVFTDSAAAKTVTLEMLASDTFAAGLLDRSLVWMTVSYVKNSDNTVVTESTRLDLPGTALTASIAAWSGTSWGAVACNKYKLALTTAHAIKQNTMVTVCLHWTPACGSTNEQVFICPDVQLS